MAPYSGPKDMFASVAIGLNPEWKVIEDPGDFRPEDAAGMVTMRDDGFRKAVAGVTTLEEVLRVTPEQVDGYISI